jgi:hypothetical protein
MIEPSKLPSLMSTEVPGLALAMEWWHDPGVEGNALDSLIAHLYPFSALSCLYFLWGANE